jgi:hypothetical protein
MLQTIEATIDQTGQIIWSEPVHIQKTQKILITFLEPSQISKNTTLDDVAGCLTYQGKPKSLEEMEQDVAEGLKNEYAANH